LLKGDKIITQNKTKVQIILNDDTTITIGSNSSFAFLDYTFDGTKNSSVSMKSTRGFFRSVTGQIGKLAPERFKVQTNLATIGIRGTDFSAQINENKALYRCYSGEIKVAFNGKERSIIEGEMLHLHLEGGAVKEKPVSETTIGSKFQKISPDSKFGGKDLSDLSEIKDDVTSVQYNCQHN